MEPEIIKVIWGGKLGKSIWINCPNSESYKSDSISKCSECIYRKGLVFGQGVLCEFNVSIERRRKMLEEQDIRNRELLHGNKV